MKLVVFNFTKFSSKQMQMKFYIQFHEIFVKSKANQVAVFTFTNFSVKSNPNQVAVFNFTNFSVKTNASEVLLFDFTKFLSNQKQIKLQYIQFHEISVKSNSFQASYSIQ